MGIRFDFCEVNGTKLRACAQGEGDCVLLVHGGYGNLAVWDEVADALAAHYNVIRFDQRGFGQSAEPVGPFSYAEDIKGILDHYGISRAHIVGSSFGGSAAIDFALQYPQAVGKLVLAGPSINGRRYPLRMQWKGIADFLRVRRVGIEKAADRLLADPYWGYIVPRDEDRRRKFRDLYVSNAAYYRSKPTWAKPLAPAAASRLGELRGPMLVIEPENDLPFNKQACEMLARGANDATRVVMRDTGHYPHLERPGDFAAIVLDYLKA